MKKLIFLISVLTISIHFSIKAQIPTKVFEIESILVDACAGSNEGENEMLIFMTGPNRICINDIRVDGAGSTGLITSNVWPNTNNPFRGWSVPGTMATEVTQINATITNCGFLIEPMDDSIPAGKKCLIITSTNFNPIAHSFSSLADTLYIIFQNAGNTSGHFVNYGTSSVRTLVLVHTLSSGADTITYNRSLLINQSGNPGGQDGAGVRYTWAGIQTYYNDSCQAPYIAVSATWINPGIFCQNDAPIDLSTLVTGSTGGNWSGSGVSGTIFDPSGLSGNIYITYAVGINPCGDTVTQTIIVDTIVDASITAAGPFCSNDAPLNLFAVSPGGTWAGTGITNSTNGTFNPMTAGAGIHTIIYTISGACSDADTININVNQSSDATITVSGPYCILDPAINLTASDTGGVWSGTGITDSNNGTFNPGIAGAGNHTITYGISGQCGDTASTVITVNPQANASISPAGPYCDNDFPISLTAANSGGTWTGSGITNGTNGVFDPSIAGNGLHQIMYTISGSCGDADTIEIQIWEAPDIAIFGYHESCLDQNDGSAWINITGGTSPYFILWQNNSNSDTISNLSPGIYGVLITDANSCTKTDSVQIIESTESCYIPHIYIPNIFSPNGDGNNDVLQVHGLRIETMKLLIFDRWGEKVFESHSLDNSWDGSYEGVPANPGVYIYSIIVSFDNDSQLEQNGNITLIR